MFLKKVAQDIKKHSNDYLLDLQILFSNKRAIKYFNQEFKLQDKQTLWQPECKSIADFVQEYSLLKPAEEFSLIYQLFLSYKEICKKNDNETFEIFYNWGKIILSDFDDIDKNLVDAKQVFRLIEDYKEVENTFDYLTEQQKELLNNFFTIFEQNTDLKNNFKEIWNCLFDIYCHFKEKLYQQGIGYSGMIYREFLSRIENGEIRFRNKNFAIVGFNVLNKCEENIFRVLKDEYCVDFYWDYDEYYTNSDYQEAGIFMKKNLTNFPHNQDFANNNFNSITKNKEKINLIKTSYEIENTYYIKTWIESLENKYKDDLKQNEIAIILGNENLLPFVLNSLPNKINNQEIKVNIAMGYPLANITLFNEIEEKIDEIQKAEKSIVEQIEELTLFVKEKGEKKHKTEIIQSCYGVIKILSDFKDTLSFNKIEFLQNNFLKKTLLYLLRRLHIPFESDATDGIQIMGLLESRNLTFKHVLVLSANEGYIPKINNVNSFIPLSVRDAFGLIDQKKKIAVFAYYFYRLLQNRKDLDFVYNTLGLGGKIKEMTRFLLQLRFESTICFEEKYISLPMKEQTNLYYENLFKKTDQDLEELKKKRFSASMINTYLDCGRKFYFKYIKKLTPPEETDISYLVFGRLFHKSAERFVESEYTLVETDCVNLAFEEFKDNEKEVITQSEKDTCVKYLEALKKYYKSDNKFLEAEKEIEEVKIFLDGFALNLYGVIDRIDTTKDGDYIVIDYKTSKKKKIFDNNIPKLFDSSLKEKRNAYALQILFYAYLLQKKGYKVLDTQLIYPHLLHKDSNCSVSEFNNAIYNEYENNLKKCLEEIFDKEKQWESTKNCNYCDYKEICSNFEASNERDE
ncbi:MAG: PD-(D/E)XK nuclease family protein [Bacteroidales bacterium]|nr:PD-(D/E)XK nuclease family protein [Bacteroidales bacterium]